MIWLQSQCWQQNVYNALIQSQEMQTETKSIVADPKAKKNADGAQTVVARISVYQESSFSC